MKNRTLVLKLAVCALFAGTLLVAGAATTPSFAAGTCPTGQSACLVVNTNQDDNVRDGKLSLREAMMLDNGSLSFAGLTSIEQMQVRGSDITFAADGIRNIYFDPTVFCETCNTRLILLTPPGFGGPATSPGTEQAGLDNTPPGFGGPVSLPPGFGGPVGAPEGYGNNMGADKGLMAMANELLTPPGFGGPGASIGLGLMDGAEVAATVVLDGTLLDDSTAGMRLENNGGTIRGLRFQNFRATALQIHTSIAEYTTIGSNFDGVLDTAEAVTFSNNDVDYEVVFD